MRNSSSPCCLEGERPEYTQNREGYYWVTSIHGTVAEARLNLHIRDFTQAGFEHRRNFVAALVETFQSTPRCPDSGSRISTCVSQCRRVFAGREPVSSRTWRWRLHERQLVWSQFPYPCVVATTEQYCPREDYRAPTCFVEHTISIRSSPRVLAGWFSHQSIRNDPRDTAPRRN